MARYDFHSPRLYLDADLASGTAIELGKAPAHYLGHVLRRKPGDAVLVFNGRDGEWRASLKSHGKRTVLMVQECTREQTRPLDLHYVFAPLKHERLDYMAQKAVEMGASRLQPVLTHHTQVQRVNIGRLRANAIEAAEQCGILSIPEIGEPTTFHRFIAARDSGRLLVFCDEDADVKDPIAALADAREGPNTLLPLTMPDASSGRQPLAVLIGPEGGFNDEERALLLKQPNIVRLSLGPRILRADTAAVAALALVQAVLGDWT
jgi:16S rRNA (uracil1498-N3)-methyltransferase